MQSGTLVFADIYEEMLIISGVGKMRCIRANGKQRRTTIFFRGPSESLQSDVFFAIRQCDLRVAKHDSLLMRVSISVNYVKEKKGRLRTNLTSRLLKRASREE
jgi:hypothetical protein